MLGILASIAGFFASGWQKTKDELREEERRKYAISRGDNTYISMDGIRKDVKTGKTTSRDNSIYTPDGVNIILANHPATAFVYEDTLFQRAYEEALEEAIIEGKAFFKVKGSSADIRNGYYLTETGERFEIGYGWAKDYKPPMRGKLGDKLKEAHYRDDIIKLYFTTKNRWDRVCWCDNNEALIIDDENWKKLGAEVRDNPKKYLTGRIKTKPFKSVE